MGEAEYISSASGITERADRIASIITSLENLQIASISNANMLSYKLNDGQTIIETIYRSPEQINKAITQYEQILNRLLARINNTNIVRLVDAQAVKENGYYSRY